MRDYQKELADSLDKSDQIAKLEAKVEELQRQLAEAQELIADRTSDVKFEYEERIKAESQLAEAQYLASQINTDWIPANKRLAEKLAEREAVIADMKKIAEHVITYLDDNLSYDREADYAIEQLNELVAIPTDHTALDELQRQLAVKNEDITSWVEKYAVKCRQLAEREAALRELCLRVAMEVAQNYDGMTIEAIVDEVLVE